MCITSSIPLSIASRAPCKCDAVLDEIAKLNKKFTHYDAITKQNEELKMRNEELAKQNEELKMRNEELKMRNEELAKQNEELKMRNEELAKQNEELKMLFVPSNEDRASQIRSIHRKYYAAHNVEEIMKNIMTRELAMGYDSYLLQMFASDGKLGVVKILVDHGANIRAKDDYAIRWAAWGGHIDVMRFLAERDANVRAKDDEIIRDLVKMRDANMPRVGEIVKIFMEFGGSSAVDTLNKYFPEAINRGLVQVANAFRKYGVSLPK